MLGLRWVCRWTLTNLDLVYTSAQPKEVQQNDQATWLTATVTVCPETGGIARITHQRQTGTVALFHEDGAEIHPHHLTTFNEFLATIVPLSQTSVGHIAWTGSATITSLKEKVTREKFERFWDTYVIDATDPETGE